MKLKLIIGTIIVILAAGGYFVWKKYQTKPSTPIAQNEILYYELVRAFVELKSPLVDGELRKAGLPPIIVSRNTAYKHKSTGYWNGYWKETTAHYWLKTHTKTDMMKLSKQAVKRTHAELKQQWKQELELKLKSPAVSPVNKEVIKRILAEL